MKKFFVLGCMLFLFPISLFAVDSEDVDYEINDYIVDAKIDVSGNILIKEVIGVRGTFNGYIRDIVYKNDLRKFDGSLDSFKGSDIYNVSSVEIRRVGTIDFNGKLDFSVFDKEVKESKVCGSKYECYQESNIHNGISLKMYNETKDDVTYFYIEYVLGNVVVMHEDVAEVYYNFIGSDFDDDIENYQLRLSLPLSTNEQIRVWAHGPLHGEVKLISESEDENKSYYGGYLYISELPSNTPVDMRMTFPLDLIKIEHPFLKKSNISALSSILEVENIRAEEANRERKLAKIEFYTVYGISGVFLIVTLGLGIYIYIKYDKERIASFQNEYNREFIDDYDVTVIEYLFDKKVTEKGFSTSILNMIYKKNISFEKIDNKEYKFKKISEEGLDDAEKMVMDIIFNQAGDGKETTLSKIKKYASKVKDVSSPFLNSFNKWKNKVTNNAVKEQFYENNTKVKVICGLYSLFGFVLLFFHIIFGLFGLLTFLLAFVNIVFLIYVIIFTKRTIRGTEHYAKWKAFKRFLLDFGRFSEKELPEIVLWERYLVYASIFGIADKVSKLMKIKFNELNYNSNYTSGDFVFDYMMWGHLSRSINSTINNSISVAHTNIAQAVSSSNSSSGGFGGGFSSGGGFGGGGGGGRGF